MIQEISRSSISLTRNEEAYLTWCNAILMVRTDKDIVLFEFTKNLQCLDKKIDMKSYSMPVSKSSPLMGLIPHNLLSHRVKNIDYTEMILDPSLWPHNPNILEEMTVIADIKWSPIGVMRSNECALAVLNNVGNIDFLGRGRFVWNTVLNLSDIIKEIYLASGEFADPRTLSQLKRLAYAVETSAICWGPKLESNCLFATAQKNGDILFWSIVHQNFVLKAQFLNKIPTEFGEIVSMVWIPKEKTDFTVVCSNVFGEIFALNCTLLKDSQIEVVGTTILWSQKDKMVVKYICHNIIDDKIILICNKHRHLLILVVDKTGQVVAQCAKNVNDYKITDIKSNNYGNYLTTANCKFYRIFVKVDKSHQVDLDLELIDMNNIYSSYELYGLSFSTNSVIWALSVKQKRIIHRQRKQKILDVVFVTLTNPQQSESKELTLLLKNQTGKLTNYWDCIELLRYRTMKTSTMPLIDYQDFWSEAEKDIYKLKLYFIFLNLFLSLEKLTRNPSRTRLPEMSLNAVKEKILALHAKNLITEINCSMNNEGMLEKIEYDKYYGAKRYLLYYCKKFDRDVGDFVEFPEWMSTNKHMPKTSDICQSCDNELQGFTCNEGHFNIFCSLTFTPIPGFDYLVCSSCGATARSELYSTDPLCVFCDIYLSNETLPT